MLSICLLEPEIPQNTGNIARTCAVTGSRLYLVRPLGFDISEKAVRHAGLDYWNDVDISVYENADEFFSLHGNEKMYFFSTKGRKTYADENLGNDDVIFVFGRESRGIDENILIKYPDSVLRIPMKDDSRSLNLSNSVAVAAYEYYRQTGFSGMRTCGELYEHSWEDL